MKEKLKSSNKYLFLLILIILVGIFLRIYAFDNLTTSDSFTWIGGDNSHYFEVADNIKEGKGPVIDFIFQFWERRDFGENDALWEPLLPYSLSSIFILFGKSILASKMFIFTISIITIPTLFFLGSKIYNKNVGIISSFLIAIHPKHIEYSVSIFKDNLYVFFFIIAFGLVLLAIRENKISYWILLGISLALSFLSRYITIILLVTLITVIILERKKINWKYFLVGAIIFILILIPWGVYTFVEFDQPFFSITKHYTYSTEGWEGMSFEGEDPNISEYLEGNSLKQILLQRFGFFLMASYMLIWLFNPASLMIFINSLFVKDKYLRNIKIYLIIFTVFYFIQFSNNNLLIERAFFGLVYASLIPISHQITKYGKKNKQIMGIILAIIVIISLALLQIKIEEIKSYEMVEKQKDLKELGIWSKLNLKEEDVIMTILPSDVHFYTNQKTVMDPYNFALNSNNFKEKYRNRSFEEIKEYNVSHVLIHTKNTSALKGFENLELQLIYEDKNAELFLYSIK